jgi:hypothetical protein
VVSVALAYGGSELRRREGVSIVALYVAFVVVVVSQ